MVRHGELESPTPKSVVPRSIESVIITSEITQQHHKKELILCSR